MQPTRPNDYLWQEMYPMMQQVETALQMFTVYMQWFCLAAAVFAAAGLAVVCLLAWQQHAVCWTSRRARP